MKLLIGRFLDEPAFALGVLNATLQVVAAVALPGWSHIAAVAGGMVAAVSTRQLVTPTASALRETQPPATIVRPVA